MYRTSSSLLISVAVKYRYRQSHNESDAHSSYNRVQKLDDYHGLPSGIFACDEHLAGKMPSRGKLTMYNKFNRMSLYYIVTQIPTCKYTNFASVLWT